MNKKISQEIYIYRAKFFIKLMIIALALFVFAVILLVKLTWPHENYIEVHSGEPVTLMTASGEKYSGKYHSYNGQLRIVDKGRQVYP